MAFRDSINDLMFRFYERFKQNNNRLPVSVDADINVGDVQIGTVKQGGVDEGAEPWKVKAEELEQKIDALKQSIESGVQLKGSNEDLPIRGRIEVLRYYYGQILPGTSNNHFRPRSQGTSNYVLKLGSSGAFDMAFSIRNTLKAEGANVTLNAVLRQVIRYEDDGSDRWGPIIWQGDIPYDSRMTWAPERGIGVQDTSTARIVEVPELRQPHEGFMMQITRPVAPDEGDIFLQIVRRY